VSDFVPLDWYNMAITGFNREWKLVDGDWVHLSTGEVMGRGPGDKRFERAVSWAFLNVGDASRFSPQNTTGGNIIWSYMSDGRTTHVTCVNTRFWMPVPCGRIRTICLGVEKSCWLKAGNALIMKCFSPVLIIAQRI